MRITLLPMASILTKAHRVLVSMMAKECTSVYWGMCTASEVLFSIPKLVMCMQL